MCVLIHHKPGGHLTPEMLRDMLIRNGDSFGAMFADKGRVHVIKSVQPTTREVEYLYERYLKDRECIIHFRMRTHGAIDYDNCHPYEVFPDLHMAHNGVLSVPTPNSAMSDTWHLIENHVRPVLRGNPDVLFEKPFIEMLGAFIGSSNKLAFLDGEGRVAVVNRSSGFEHKGVWFSNSYAWSPSKFGITPPSKGSTSGGGWSSRGRYGGYYDGWTDDELGYGSGSRASSATTPSKSQTAEASPQARAAGATRTAEGVTNVIGKGSNSEPKDGEGWKREEGTVPALVDAEAGEGSAVMAAPGE